MTDYSGLTDEQLLESGFSGEILTEIVSRYMGMIFSLAKGFSHGADYDELVSDGMQALLSAVSGYKPERGAFSAFAAVCVSNRMKNTVKRSARHAMALADGDELEAVADPAPTPEEAVISREISEELYKLILTRLSPLEKTCLDGVIFGLSYAQIAEKIGADRKTVDNAVARARAKLRGFYADFKQ